jgi:uncharacterized protein (DUF1330 family)
MSFYFVSNIKVSDFEEYKKYINEVDEIFSKYNGKYLALDDNPTELEGRIKKILKIGITQKIIREYYVID